MDKKTTQNTKLNQQMFFMVLGAVSKICKLFLQHFNSGGKSFMNQAMFSLAFASSRQKP
jgi:hypothetical protein